VILSFLPQGSSSIVEFATNMPCVADAPLRMKKCYTLDRRGTKSRDRLDISVTNLSTNMIEYAAQAPQSVAPGIGKHVGEDLTHAWHPVVLTLKTRRNLARLYGGVHPMEELLPSALFLVLFSVLPPYSADSCSSTFSGEG
jgi:hypothetical protein